MKNGTLVAWGIISFLIGNSLVFARPNYTGYSGAPGANGRCASSCHGNSGGTIEIDGFPAEYVPEQSYTITISHAGGSSIRQFNGSSRVGTGPQNAGVITSGTNTSTYNVSGETNGIHFSSSSHDNGTFVWSAPPGGTGEVRLYIAGLQGNYGGQNSTIQLISNEASTGVDQFYSELPAAISLKGNYPNPFNASTIISYELTTEVEVAIKIFDLCGREIAEVHRGLQGPGEYSIPWNPAGSPSGVYFYRIKAGDFTENGKMLLLK